MHTVGKNGILIALIVFLAAPFLVFADEFISADFKVLDPVLFPGGYSTSDDFKLRGVIGQTAIGIGEGADFNIKSGFLYFSAPVEPDDEPSVPPPPPGDGIILDLLRKFVPPVPKFLLITEGRSPCFTDINCDGKINLVDLSIFLFFTSQPTPNPVDFNNDSKVNAKDLSILFFDWTERLLAFGSKEDRVYEDFDGELEDTIFDVDPQKQVASVVHVVAVEKDIIEQKPKSSDERGVIGRISGFIVDVVGGALNFFWSLFK